MNAFLFQKHDARIIVTASYEDKSNLVFCAVSRASISIPLSYFLSMAGPIKVQLVVFSCTSFGLMLGPLFAVSWLFV